MTSFLWGPWVDADPNPPAVLDELFFPQVLLVASPTHLFRIPKGCTNLVIGYHDQMLANLLKWNQDG